jgi:hypothetical protein
MNLPHVLWRSLFGQPDQQFDDRTDGVLAYQVVVEPQVVNPLIPQLIQQIQGFLG